MPRDIRIQPNRSTTGSTQQPTIFFSGTTAASINLKVEDDGSLTFEGNNGGLFNITDSKDGLLSSVNDVSGLPIFAVYSSDKVIAGGYNQNALTVDTDKVFIGSDTRTLPSGVKLAVSGNTLINGTLSASTLNLFTTPTLNNSNTQILSRNSSTGVIEFSTLSAITTDYYVTGGTFSGTTLTLDRQNGSVIITGFTSNSVDTYTTGFTYSNNNLTILQNNGVSPISVDINTMTGLTINGDLNVTGLTQTNGVTSTGGITFKQVTINSTYTATTEDYMIDVSGGTFSVYLPSAIGIQGRLLNIKNNGGGAVTIQPVIGQTIDDKSFVILGETNSLQLVSNGVNWVALGYNISTVNSSTGVFEFSGLTIVSSTSFNVAPVKGWIVDDTTNPLSPQLYYLSYSGGTHTSTYVTTDTETWVYLDNNSNVLQSNIALTEQQRRQNIFLGKIDHSNKTNIIDVFSQPDFVLSPLSQLRDVFVPINLINGGIRPSPNGVNLNFNTSAGYLYGLGINFSNDTLTPNTIYVSGTSPCTFQYLTQTGGSPTNVTLIDPTKYDVGGVVTNLTGTKATNQRIYLLQNGQVRIQYGQVNYNTLVQAVAGIATEQFVEFSNLTSNGILIGILSVLSTATDLSDTTKALFFNVSKFGDSSGAAGGTPTTTLQQAYNNSSSPEIITNSTLDGVQFRGGTGNDDDKNIIIESNAGVQTAWITASGDSKFNSVSATTINTDLIDFNTNYTGGTTQGRISWDSGTGTLNIGVGDPGGTLIDLQVGQEEVVRVYNDELTTLNKGELVYVSGSQGNRPAVKRAIATSDGYSVTTLGMVDANINSGDEGYVTTFGIISNLNTLGLTGGTPIFLSPTVAGGYTSTKPQAPEHIVLIGYVVRVDATVGSVFVNISNGWELNEIHDVRISGVTTGDLLMYSSYSGSPLWVNTKTLQGDYTINGELTITGTTNVSYIDFDTSLSGTTPAEGRLFWDVNNRTLSLGMVGGPIQQIGEEQYYLVENQTNGTLIDGSVVRAVGTNGNDGKLLVDSMIANGTIPAFTTLGVLTQQLLSGETGYVTSFGLVRGLDTSGSLYGETWVDGTILYVSPTILGGFTSVKPTTPNQDIIIAIVMKAGTGTTGSIFVRPDVYRPFKDPYRITVAKQNGDFTSIRDAVNSLSGLSSSINRYVIDVGPGNFSEGEIDLTNTPYVSIVGSNIQTTLISPTGSTQHIIKIGINNEISFLSLSGAPSGYAGIYCYDIGDFAQAHKVSFYDCDTNVWVESNTQDTKFYGEYLDFNGNFSYGTKSIGNNNYLSLANLENYYNFPTGTGITICNYSTGSGGTINIFVGDNVSNGVSGTTAFLIQDGSSLNASSITIDGFTYGIRNPNIGNPVRFDVDNASIVNGELDLSVERIGTFGTFGGSSSHEKIYTISSDVYWNFLDIEDGELDITRKSSITFADGTHTDFTTLVFDGSTMGLMDGGEITIVSGFTVSTASGFGYLSKTLSPEIYKRIDWNNSQITLGANENKYIYINENGILSSSGGRPSSIFNIVLGRVVTDSTGVSFIDLSPAHSDHTSNRFGDLFREAMGPIYASGSIVTENTTPFNLDVSSGEYYYSTSGYLPSGGTQISFTQYYRDGIGGWITTATTIVNNTSYDGNGALSALTAGYYTKHTLYVVGDGSYENYFLVLGQNEYSSLVSAEGALLPTPPTFFTDSVSQIANIYIQQGVTGITQVEDIRPVIGFKAGGVNASSVHGNLLGLSADDHTQYLLVSGGRAMSGNLDMGGNQITNVGNVDGVDVSSHATRHQFGGLDAVGTITPSANAIPYSDVNSKLDGWISTATTSTIGLVKLSTTPVSASNPIVVGDNDTRLLKSITGITYSLNVLSATTVDGTINTTTIGLKTKANTATGTSFTGNPKKYNVVFTTSYPNTNYSIQITGAVNRSFTYESKTTTGFTINTNANTTFTENVDWVTTEYGES